MSEVVGQITRDDCMFKSRLVLPLDFERHAVNGLWRCTIMKDFAVGSIDPDAQILGVVTSDWLYSSDQALAQAMRRYADITD